MKVYVDSRCDIRYASFYIYGLRELLGRSSLIFSNKYSRDVDLSKCKDIVDRVLLLTIIDSRTNYKRKIIIDARDVRTVIDSAYDWCDVYAKVNYIASENTTYAKKIVLIPPSFAIRPWSIITNMTYCIYNLFLSYINFSANRRCTLLPQLKSYIYLVLRRAKYEEYKKPISVRPNYLFFISSLWNYKECIDSTNAYRYQFLKTCRNLSEVDLEGGFVIHRLSAEIPEDYRDFCLTTRYRIRSFINKTKQSLIVFNTPAVRECHGWKLGEFLCLGKAIISTPLINDLPEPLIHGKNIHIVSNIEELIKATKMIIADKKYRKLLESEALKYWENNCEPADVMRKIIDIKL